MTKVSKEGVKGCERGLKGWYFLHVQIFLSSSKASESNRSTFPPNLEIFSYKSPRKVDPLRVFPGRKAEGPKDAKKVKTNLQGCGRKPKNPTDHLLERLWPPFPSSEPPTSRNAAGQRIQLFHVAKQSPRHPRALRALRPRGTEGSAAEASAHQGT